MTNIILPFAIPSFHFSPSSLLMGAKIWDSGTDDAPLPFTQTPPALSRGWAGHTGAGPGQKHALEIYRCVSKLRNRTATITWVKGHAGVPGNERAGKLSGEATEKLGRYTVTPLAHLKLKISNDSGEPKKNDMRPTGRWRFPHRLSRS